TIHVDVDLRVIEALLNARVNRAGNFLHDCFNALSDLQRGFQVVTLDLNIDRRWEPEVQRGRKQPACVISELKAGKLRWQILSQPGGVLLSALAALRC